MPHRFNDADLLPDPRREDAYLVHASVVYRDHKTCCGSTRVSVRRYGARDRMVLAKVRVTNDGNPLGYYISSIHRVTIHFERP
jgi:hypothetical protein